MSVTKILQVAKTGSQIVIITALLTIVFDLLLGYFLNDSVAYMCRDEVLHHRYCPGATRTYRMADIDGGRTIKSHWNLDGVRVSENEKNERSSFNQYDHILVGDSFIAQRQVDYGARLTDFMNKKALNAIQVGTGSWNLVNYRNFVRNTTFKKGATIHIFLMANDFYSNYGLSTANYYKTTTNGETWPGYSENLNTSMLRFFSNHSYVYQSLKYKIGNRGVQKTITRDSAPLIRLARKQADCAQLEQYRNSLGNQAFALIEQAFDATCLSENAKANFSTSQTIFHELQEHANQNHLKLVYYLIPNGTIFSDEATGFKRAYGIHESSVVTSQGLYETLQAINAAKIINIENYLAEHKTDRLFYYPHDGHWNEYGSAAVAELIIGQVN